MKREIINIDEEKCDGCGICIPSCAEGALQIVDNKARLVKESYCDGLGACLNECPKGAITMEERNVEAFNEEEVKLYLNNKETTINQLACGCPSSTDQSWITEGEKGTRSAPSLLSHWPVKLRLASPEAPYFNNSELVVAADCGPFAYGNFHKDFISGRAVVTGCPKFGDLELYEEKLTEILLNSEIKKIIVVRMEVPCCSGWLNAVWNAIYLSGREIPVEEKVIGIQGEILDVVEKREQK